MIPDIGARRVRSVALEMAALLLLSGAAALVGMASSLTIGTVTLGAATVAPARCTTAGLTVTPTLVAAAWTSVVVGALPAACGNATLQVTVSNGLTNGSGSATVPVGGGSVTVTLSLATAVTTTMQTDLLVTGP